MMNWFDKIKPTKGDVYIKGNALPESDYETATGRTLYTIIAMRKAYDAGWDAALAQRPWQGLTEEEKFEIAAEQHGWEDLLIAAEAKLKERNNA